MRSHEKQLATYTPQAMFDILEADIVVMQETKIQRKDLRDDMVLVPGWDVSFSLPKHKKGKPPLTTHDIQVIELKPNFTIQATLESPFILATRHVHRYEQRKASLAVFLLQDPQPASAISLKINKLEDILSLDSSLVLLTKPLSTLKGGV